MEIYGNIGDINYPEHGSMDRFDSRNWNVICERNMWTSNVTWCNQRTYLPTLSVDFKIWSSEADMRRLVTQSHSFFGDQKHMISRFDRLLLFIGFEKAKSTGTPHGCAVSHSMMKPLASSLVPGYIHCLTSHMGFEISIVDDRGIVMSYPQEWR